jgi:hypothetical protein
LPNIIWNSSSGVSSGKSGTRPPMLSTGT